MYEVLEFIANYEIRFREDEVKYKRNDHFLIRSALRCEF